MRSVLRLLLLVACVSLALSTGATRAAAAGSAVPSPIASWRFDEADKSNWAVAADEMGYHNGVYQWAQSRYGFTALTDVEGHSGRAAQFTVEPTYPNNDSPNLADVMVPSLRGFGSSSASFTVSMWVKGGVVDTRYNRGLIGVGSWHHPPLGWAMYIPANTGKLAFIGGNQDAVPSFRVVSPGNVIPAAEWTHIAAVYSKGDAKVSLYVDGAKVVEGPSAGFIPGDQPLYIGGAYLEFIVGGGSFKYVKQTSLDDVQLWNTALTDAQILDLYRSYTGPDRVPLIFVPGIMGSELSCSGEEIWPRAAIDRFGSFFGLLALANHGTVESSCAEPMSADAVIESAYSNDQYGATLKALEDAGYEQGTTLFTYPFDWRRSVSDAARGLLEKIDAVRAQTGAERVDVMAHSQGGLVTRAALAEPSSIGKVRRVLTLGTPYYGAAKLLGVLLAGKPCVPGTVEIRIVVWWVSWCALDGQDVQSVVSTLPGAHDLIPSLSYFDAVRPPIRLNGFALTPAEYKSYLEAAADPVLVDDAFERHAAYDAKRPADSGVDWLQVYGEGELTIGDVFLSSDPELDWASFQYIDGDGTVPTGSALSGHLFVTAHEVGADHMGLVRVPCSLGFAAQYFSADVAPSEGGCAIADTVALRTMSAMRASGATIGLEVALDGALSGEITDAAGRSTGEKPPSAIPNSDFNAAGSSQSFLFRDLGAYHATFTSVADGIARIRIRTLALDGVTGQALFLVPDLPPDARLTFDAGGGPLGDERIQVDADGNGSVDAELVPDAVTGEGVADEDVTPPSVFGGATLGTSGLSQVTLAAEDEPGGSGAARVYYRVGDGAEQTYSGPFDVPMLSRVSFRAMDRAGNMSEEQTLVADDAPNDARFATQIESNDHLRRLIDPRGDEDWYRFDTAARSRVRVFLDGLVANYDLEVRSESGKVLAASRKERTASERIDTTLDPGTYYVRVVGDSGASDPKHAYQLDLKVDAAA